MVDVELDALMAAVRRRAGSEQPLHLLRAAVEVTERLSETADELLSRHVATAREAGCAWSQIGELLGVSRQAAQQRFGDAPTVPDEIEMPMSPRLRRALRLARKEARLLGAAHVDTAHLLLGVLSEGRGLAARLLADLGVEFESIVGELDARSGSGSSPAPDSTLTEDAAEALRLALVEAKALGVERVGTEHLLVGLLTLERGAAHAVLSESDVDAAAVRQRITETLQSPSVSTRGGRLRMTARS